MLGAMQSKRLKASGQRYINSRVAQGPTQARVDALIRLFVNTGVLAAAVQLTACIVWYTAPKMGMWAYSLLLMLSKVYSATFLMGAATARPYRRALDSGSPRLLESDSQFTRFIGSHQDNSCFDSCGKSALISQPSLRASTTLVGCPSFTESRRFSTVPRPPPLLLPLRAPIKPTVIPHVKRALSPISEMRSERSHNSMPSFRTRIPADMNAPTVSFDASDLLDDSFTISTWSNARKASNATTTAESEATQSVAESAPDVIDLTRSYRFPAEMEELSAPMRCSTPAQAKQHSRFSDFSTMRSLSIETTLARPSIESCNSTYVTCSSH